MPTKLSKNSPVTPSTPSETPLDFTNVPVIFADNVSAVSIGPFISKIVLAMESAPPNLTPSMQIALPSNVLHAIASQVLAIMGQSQVKEQLTEAHATFIKSLP